MYIPIGGLGSGEINLDNMSAFDIKAMYASFQQSRRPSIPSNDFQVCDRRRCGTCTCLGMLSLYYILQYYTVHQRCATACSVNSITSAIYVIV